MGGRIEALYIQEGAGFVVVPSSRNEEDASVEDP